MIIENYINNLFVKQTKEQKELEQKSFIDGSGINIAPFQGKLIETIAKMIDAKRILEIGSLYGYSASFLLQALGADGELTLLEKDPMRAEYIAAHYANDPRVKLFSGDALDNINQIEATTLFDLVFVDAAKASYKKYFLAVDSLLRKGGVIIFDNVLFKGLVCSPNQGRLAKKLAEFNEFIANNKNYQSIIIPSGDGLLICLKL
jgi:predicted O-methyltransferase YrrM